MADPNKEDELAGTEQPFVAHLVELRDRLIGRAQDSASTVAKRMAKAADEISHWPEYDYVIVNENIDTASAEIEAILRAERLRRRRRVGLTSFVRELTKGL